MKKKLIMSIATLALTLSMSVQAFANPLVVNLNGVNRVFTQATEQNNVVVVNGEELANKLEISFTYDNFTGNLKFTDGTTTLELIRNSNLGELNDKPVELPTTITDVNGVVYVPLQFIADTFGATLTTKNDEIVTDFDVPYFSDLSSLHDVTDDTTVYTFKQAVDLAMQNSIFAEQIEIGKDATEDAIYNVNSGIQFYNDNPMYLTDPQQYYELLQTRYDLTVSLDGFDDKTAQLKTGLKLNLMSSLNSLETAKMNKTMVEQNLALQTQDLDIKKVKKSLGLESTYNVQKATSTLEQTKSQLVALDTSILTTEQSINATLGLPLDSDIYIENDVVVTDRDYDLSILVSRALEHSPTVKDAKDAYDSAMNNYNSNPTAAKTSKLTYEQALKDVEKSVNSTYNNYKAIIENDKLLNLKRESAIADYKMLYEQYNAGYVTKYTLDSALLGVANIDSQILQNKMNYQLITFQFDNPSLFIVAKN